MIDNGNDLCQSNTETKSTGQFCLLCGNGQGMESCGWLNDSFNAAVHPLPVNTYWCRIKVRRYISKKGIDFRNSVCDWLMYSGVIRDDKCIDDIRIAGSRQEKNNGRIDVYISETDGKNA